MHIRRYEELDENAVIALWHECDLVRPWNDPHKDIARKLAVQRDLFLVVEHNGAVIASIMAGYEGHRGWVNYLAVSKEYRGRGVGRELMAYVEARLLELGCPKLSLLVRSTNAAVLEFYAKLGYQRDEAVPLGKRLIADDPPTSRPDRER